MDDTWLTSSKKKPAEARRSWEWHIHGAETENNQKILYLVGCPSKNEVSIKAILRQKVRGFVINRFSKVNAAKKLFRKEKPLQRQTQIYRIPNYAEIARQEWI